MKICLVPSVARRDERRRVQGTEEQVDHPVPGEQDGVGLARQPVQAIVSVCDQSPAPILARLQIAVGIISVLDRSGFWIRRRTQFRQRIIHESPGLYALNDAGEVIQRIVAIRRAVACTQGIFDNLSNTA